jgi:hypothetical protein
MNMRLPTMDEWSNLKETMAQLRLQNDNYKVQLEKYTNNERHKRYYEQNKDRVKENAKMYLNRLKTENPDKLKEYRHRAYLKRKDGKMKIQSSDDITSSLSPVQTK